MTIYHSHHIIPKHMGGNDDPSNLIDLTIEEHAAAHLELYEEHGYEQDLVAHRMLLGQIDKAEAIKILQKSPKSKRWKKQMSDRVSGKGNPMYGKTTSAKQKEAVRIANSVPKPHVSENMKKRWKEGPIPGMVHHGADNYKAQSVYAEGKVYDTLAAVQKAYNLKNHNSVAYRCKSESPKWSEWYYV